MKSTFLTLLLSLSVTLGAAPVRNGVVEAELVSAVASIQPGKPFTVALRLKHDAHWHSYWVNPGTGLATSLAWKLPEGFKAAEIEWPVPQLLRDASGKMTGYGYEGEILLPVLITPPAGLIPGKEVVLRARADWLACKESCMPGGADLTLKLPVKAHTPKGDPEWSDKIAAAYDRMPVGLPEQWKATAVRQGKTVQLHLAVAAGERPVATTLHFLSNNNFIDYEQPQVVKAAPDGYIFQLPVAESADPKTAFLSGVVRADKGWGEAAGLNEDTGLQIEVLLEAPPAL
jgi:DsbC/DsbD-like thiol-disulfide interchange protein